VPIAACDGLSDPVFASLSVSLGGGDVTVWALDCNSRASSNDDDGWLRKVAAPPIKRT